MTPQKRNNSTSRYNKHPKTRSRSGRKDSAEGKPGLRLHKVLAEAGVDSRRHCEQYILDGRVKVNGKVVDKLPAWVDPTKDKIVFDGDVVDTRDIANAIRTGRSQSHIYVLLNKPGSTVCTNRDPQGRRKAIDLVVYPGNPRLFCVGRLDADSTGLLLLTTDGDLTNQLTHPKYGIHKTYEVTIKGSLGSDEVAALEGGIHLHDRRTGVASRTQPVRLELLKRDRESTRIIMELREGRNRQIRRMMARCGHPVRKLKRIAMGPLRLKGIGVGEWRQLTPNELRSLRRAVAAGIRNENSDRDSTASSSQRSRPQSRQRAGTGTSKNAPRSRQQTGASRRSDTQSTDRRNTPKTNRGSTNTNKSSERSTSRGGTGGRGGSSGRGGYSGSGGGKNTGRGGGNTGHSGRGGNSKQGGNSGRGGSGGGGGGKRSGRGGRSPRK